MATAQLLPVPVADPGALAVRLEAVRDTLAACVEPLALTAYLAQAEAMRVYARQRQLGMAAYNYAAAVILWAERRLGEVLPTVTPHGGDRKSDQAAQGRSLIADLGLNTHQSARYRALARIPEAIFTARVAVDDARPLYLTQLYDLAKDYRPVRQAAPAPRAPLPVVPDGAGPLPGLCPYYADDAARIYLYCADAGACPDELAALAADVLITDPPYGVALGTSTTTTGLYKNGRAGYAQYRDTHAEWQALVPPLLRRLLPTVRRAAVWAGPHSWELPEPVAIGGVYCPAAMGRHAWGFKNFLPVLFYGKDPRQGGGPGTGCYPTVIESNATAAKNGHPCPKPQPWLDWLVARASRPGEWILDPFAGSGTTLLAAKLHHRPAIGIEIDESYCAIAAAALRGDLPPGAAPLFEAVPAWAAS